MLLHHTVFHKYQDNKIIENMSENTNTLLGDVKINIQIHIEKYYSKTTGICLNMKGLSNNAGS